MSSSEVTTENKPLGGCLLGNWVEERATALLDKTEPRPHIQKSGHRGILTVDLQSSKANGISTVKAAFTTPKRTEIKQRGLRAELLEKHLVKSMSEQIHTELNPEPPAPELYSVTRSDYTVEGFQCVRPAPSMGRDYKTDQAITFWSENYQKIQGVTGVRTSDSPFRRNATFSTPITECLDDPMAFISENCPNMVE